MSGKKRIKKPVYCWDSCTVLAWFKQEKDKPLDDIALVIQEIENDRAVLLVSTILLTEVLDTAKSGSAAADFRNFIDRSSVRLADVDPRVAEKAANLRAKVLDNKKYTRKLRTPDAIILATAIIYDADVVHSLDRDFLRLSNTDDAERMTITKPKIIGGQTSLLSGTQDGGEKK